MAQDTPLGANEAQPDIVLYHNDLSDLPLGSLPFYDPILSELCALPLAPLPGGLYTPVTHPSWTGGGFKVIERGLGKYIETLGGSPHFDNRILIAGDEHWRDYRVRAVVTPLSFEDCSPAGGICGILARYADSGNYLALVLDRDGQVKLLQRCDNVFEVLDARPLEFCLGQSLTLTLKMSGNEIHGTAGPYSGATSVRGIARAAGARAGGKAGFIADVHARFGPFTVEAAPQEAARVNEAKAAHAGALSKKRARYPAMRLERTVPLHGLVNGRNLRIADVNRDGKPEIILAQSSKKIASDLSLTRLTCLSVLDLDGKLLWQAGVPDPDAPLIAGDLPFQVHDLYGDGGKVIVCVFGYDLQIRDGRTGKVLFSAATPDMQKSAVGADFKEVTSNFGAPWGDEALNMNVSAIGFCDTQGLSGGIPREILIKDDFHHLVVLDAMSEPALQPLFRHRGNHGRYPWIGDLDGDGRDEILAGYSLIDDSGRSIGALPFGGHPSSVAVLDPLNPGGENKRILIAADDGLAILNATAPFAAPARSPRGRPAARMSIAKFRADLPGLQIATVARQGSAGLFSFYDATGKCLWTKEFPPLGAPGCPVNWSGRAEELLLYSLSPGAGLLDGFGDLAVEAPASGPSTFCATSAALSADGRDALLGWDSQLLAIYLPCGAPEMSDVYAPRRPGAENASSFAALLSLPPDW